MMWGDHWMYGGWMMWLFWIAVIVGLVFLIRWIVQQGKEREPRSKEDALEILKKRYARGEIDKEEFEQKKKDLI
jgi:putative membrane protein